MGFLVGMSDIARHLLWMLRCVAHKREHRHWVIAMLMLRQHTEIDGARVNTRRRTGFIRTSQRAVEVHANGVRAEW